MLKKSIFLFIVISRKISVVSLALNPPRLAFVWWRRGGGGGGGGAYRPTSQKSNLPSINLKRKFCMSHIYRTIPDAKFEFGIFSIFGDVTHKLSLLKRGNKSSNLYIYPLEMGLNFKK